MGKDGEVVAVLYNQSRANDQAKDRAAMVTADALLLSAVLRKPRPEFGAGACMECVRANAYNAGAIAGVRSHLASFHEEIDASCGPAHLACAVGKQPWAVRPILKEREQGIELLKMSKAFALHCTEIHPPPVL